MRGEGGLDRGTLEQDSASGSKGWNGSGSDQGSQPCDWNADGPGHFGYGEELHAKPIVPERAGIISSGSVLKRSRIGP